MNRPATRFRSLALAAVLIALASLLLLPGCSDINKGKTDDLAEARSYMRSRNFMEAEKYFERYLMSQPDGPDRWEVWNDLVDIAMNIRHDRNTAIELLEAMTVEFEDDPAKLLKIRGRLASEYEQARRYERSMEIWALMERDPLITPMEKAGIYQGMARVHMRRLEFILAQEALHMCMDLDIPQKDKAYCQYALADSYMTTEDLNDGIKELRNLLEQKGVEDDLRILSIFMLADALEQKEQSETALALFESIRFSYPNPSVIESRIEYLKNPRKK
ncbi:tetratricopeptide repeat protein [Desulfovibrio sp. OttesenSCG-928-C14]|nr:tetratricopeptide repeat protein [Desulfovibrio sp. OttesenSCG-928-C14]